MARVSEATLSTLVAARGFLDQAIAAFKDDRADGETGGNEMLDRALETLLKAATIQQRVPPNSRPETVLLPQQRQTGPEDWDDPW
jgi:hypothetical protein